jgi:hypothetical protein
LKYASNEFPYFQARISSCFPEIVAMVFPGRSGYLLSNPSGEKKIKLNFVKYRIDFALGELVNFHNLSVDFILCNITHNFCVLTSSVVHNLKKCYVQKIEFCIISIDAFHTVQW